MRSHLERYEFPNPFAMQEKICMTYSYLSLCYGLAFIFVCLLIGFVDYFLGGRLFVCVILGGFSLGFSLWKA